LIHKISYSQSIEYAGFSVDFELLLMHSYKDKSKAVYKDKKPYKDYSSFIGELLVY